MVTKFWLYVKGDPAVGIPHLETSMDLEIDVDDNDREVLRNDLRVFFIERCDNE